MPIVDHHVHGAWRTAPTRAEFELMLTESDRPAPPGTSTFDSQVGYAVRRWCAPVLDLDPHVGPDVYMARRQEFGNDEVTARFLRQSGITHFLLETGFRGDRIHDVHGMAKASRTRVDEVVRLEPLAEELALSGVGAAEFPAAFESLLDERTRAAVGLKSIVAYRYGLDFEPAAPSRAEVVDAAGRWLREVERTGEARVGDPVLLRSLIWAGVERGLPLQFHVGYGDPDLDLERCDPLRMTGFLERVDPIGIPIMLLHTYPYHRNAGYLAQMFPNVYMDVGLGVNYTGARSRAVVAESLELAPFAKVLFSTDAWGMPELHYLGTTLWKSAMLASLELFVVTGEWSTAGAVRVIHLIAHENAERVYSIGNGA